MTVKSIYFLYISVILDIYSISFVLVNDKINFLWLLAFAWRACVVGLRPMNIWKLVLVVVDIWNLICQCNNGCDICKWVIQFNEGYTACAMVRLDGPLSTHIYRSSLTVMIIKAEIWATNPSLNSKHFWSFHLNIWKPNAILLFDTVQECRVKWHLLVKPAKLYCREPFHFWKSWRKPKLTLGCDTCH